MKMSDLARIAGVSKSTVSRALADSELVNPETRQMIKELAKKHGYRMDTRARNFRLKNILTIGVLLPSNGTDKWLATNPFSLEMLGALTDELELRGHELLLAKHSNSDPSWIKDFVANRSVDGIIVLGQSLYHDILNEIAEEYHHLVIWGATIPGQNYVSVGSDNYLGGQLAAKHLLERGRKNFVFLGNRNCPETTLRFEGFRDQLVKTAPKFDPTLLDCSENQSDTAIRLVSQFIDDGHPVDGLFASSDILAISAIKAMHSKNLSIPEHVSVVGYDNISLASFLNPPLTSIAQDREVAGKLLVDKLFNLIERKPTQSELIPTELIVRDSS